MMYFLFFPTLFFLSFFLFFFFSFPKRIINKKIVKRLLIGVLRVAGQVREFEKDYMGIYGHGGRYRGTMYGTGTGLWERRYSVP